MPETTSAAADAAVRAALAQVRDMRANFEDAVRRAGAAGTTTALDVQKVLSDFDALEAEVESASEDEIETLTDKAERLERLRAYVYPPAEVQFEGKTAFADLRQWGVPAAIIGPLETSLMPSLTGTDVPAARGALRALYGQYDYWAWYVDWYAAFMERVAWILIALELVVLAVAMNRLFYRDVIVGFIASGLCGAIISVIAKMPELMADAESDAYIRRILKRVGTGVAATVIGAGLLASGIVAIVLPVGEFTTLLDGCGKPRGDAVGQQPVEGGSSAKGTPTQPPAARTPVSPACSTTALFVLFALAALLGLSERALTSFEEKIFQSPPPPPTAVQVTPPIAATPPTAPPAAFSSPPATLLPPSTAATSPPPPVTPASPGISSPTHPAK